MILHQRLKRILNENGYLERKHTSRAGPGNTRKMDSMFFLIVFSNTSTMGQVSVKAARGARKPASSKVAWGGTLFSMIQIENKHHAKSESKIDICSNMLAFFIFIDVELEQ